MIFAVIFILLCILFVIISTLVTTIVLTKDEIKEFKEKIDILVNREIDEDK